MSYCCNETAESKKDKATGRLKSKDASAEMIESAKASCEALGSYDGGVLLGPALAETWGINFDWTSSSQLLTAKLKPSNFCWNISTRFWSQIPKTDGWHA